jgi:hypothetical protein
MHYVIPLWVAALIAVALTIPATYGLWIEIYGPDNSKKGDPS